MYFYQLREVELAEINVTPIEESEPDNQITNFRSKLDIDTVFSSFRSILSSF